MKIHKVWFIIDCR